MVLSILGGAGFLPSTVLTMGWVRSCCSHLQVGSMPGQPLWLRKTKVQHAPSLPFAYGFFQVIWQISQYVKWYALRLFLTQKSPKKTWAETLPEANQGTFFDKTKIRRSKISRNSWPLFVRCCSFRGARCCGFFPPDDRWPLMQQILAPCFNTLPWRNCECCTGWDFGSGWEKVRNVFLEIWEKVRTSPELKVKSQNLSMHHPPPLFLSNFPFGELPEPFGQFQSLLDQLRKRAGTSPSKVLMDVNRHVATYFVETFPSEGRLHSHGDPSNATTAGMAGTLLQGQRPWSLGILRFWTTNFLRSSKQLMQLINWGLEVVVQWNFGGNSVGAQKNKKVWKKNIQKHTNPGCSCGFALVLMFFCCFGEIKITTKKSCTVAMWGIPRSAEFLAAISRIKQQMYRPRSNRCEQNPGWFRVSWGVVLPRCIAINYCRMNLDRNSFKPISKMKWFKGFEHWSRYLLAIATLLLCSATFDDFDHWTCSLFCWQGQHEETFFKSTSPCFEWDGVGLGARSCAWKVLRGSIQVPASEKTISNRRKTRQKSNLSNLSNFSTSSRFFSAFLRSWYTIMVPGGHGGFCSADFRVSSTPGDPASSLPRRRRKSSVKT